MGEYASPVDRLLSLGRRKLGDKWDDYSRLGLTAEHVRELIRLMTDRGLNHGEFVEPQSRGPMHAWRALAQLGAAEAARPYLETLDEFNRGGRPDDSMLTDAEPFFTKLGATVVPVLQEFVVDTARDAYTRWSAADALVALARNDPQLARQVRDVLVGVLARAAENDSTLNAAIIAGLIDLEATDAVAVIQQAYAGDHVDELYIGDESSVLYELGVGPPPADAESSPAGDWVLEDAPDAPASEPEAGPGPVDDLAAHRKKRAKNRAKNKAAAKARKRNRKKR